MAKRSKKEYCSGMNTVAKKKKFISSSVVRSTITRPHTLGELYHHTSPYSFRYVNHTGRIFLTSRIANHFSLDFRRTALFDTNMFATSPKPDYDYNIMEFPSNKVANVKTHMMWGIVSSIRSGRIIPLSQKIANHLTQCKDATFKLSREQQLLKFDLNFFFFINKKSSFLTRYLNTYSIRERIIASNLKQMMR